MTAEEKAKELIEKFWLSSGMSYNDVKRCALICVDEILNISYFTHEPTEDDDLYRNYWIHVKEAIEKL